MPFCAGVLALGLSACQSLPAPVASSEKHLPTDIHSGLGQSLHVAMAQHPGQSGVYPLARGPEAFAARLAITAQATRALDVQYYIWRADSAGMLLLHQLSKAAQRGVRVRLLLDDNNTVGMDALLRGFAHQRNVQVRLFNPFVYRHARTWDYVRDFQRINRRMHNKSWTADNAVSIIGGRNIADEYFKREGVTVFADMDVLLTGAVVDHISSDFDRYWNSAAAYPIERLIPSAPAWSPPAPEQAPSVYAHALQHNPVAIALSHRTLPWQWAPTDLITDNPERVFARDNPKRSAATRLESVIGHPEKELVLVSPYLVPTRQGMQALTTLAQKGVKVTVLTNSLATTDVSAVHSGYVKYRARLVKSGVALYEMKRTQATRLSPSRGLLGHGGSSLHAKMFAVDGRRLYIGSFNFDQRSARLNTELGVLIDSAAITQNLIAPLMAQLPTQSYRLRAHGQGLSWSTQESQGVVVTHQEPNVGFMKRLWVRLLSILPLNSLL